MAEVDIFLKDGHAYCWVYNFSYGLFLACTFWSWS